MEPSEAEKVPTESRSGKAARPWWSVLGNVVVAGLGWLWLMMWISLFGHLGGACSCVAIHVLLGGDLPPGSYYVVFATGSGSCLLWLFLRAPWKGIADAICQIVRGVAAIPFFALLATFIVTFVVYAVLNIAGQVSGAETKGPPKQVAVDFGGGVKLELVLIPAGEFLMGSPASEKDLLADEKPQHRVRITRPFYLGKYPVTQEQWEAVMGNNPSGFKRPKNPVDKVNWDDCRQFLDKLNRRQGDQAGKFQLPSEAQWEYACRAGSKTRYCFGDDESRLVEYAWYGAYFEVPPMTHPVGGKKPNAWRLYDMQGHVWEWCGDWYDAGYYARSPTDDPTGPATGSHRAARGGSWRSLAGGCRSAARIGDLDPGDRFHNLGFRVCRVPADK